MNLTESPILRLQEAMSKLPQATLETQHYWADGMYCRALFRPAGTLIVGKTHKREHFYIVCYGSVQVANENGSNVYTAGTVVVSKPGTKRAVFALEDSLCMTVHRTDETDLDAIEAELIEPEELALFDSRNKELP